MQDGVYPFNDSKNYSPAKNKRFWNNVKSAWMFKPYFPMAMRMRAIAISKYSSPNSNEKTNGSQLKDSSSEYRNNDASINKLARRSPLLFRVTQNYIAQDGSEIRHAQIMIQSRLKTIIISRYYLGNKINLPKSSLINETYLLPSITRQISACSLQILTHKVYIM